MTQLGRATNLGEYFFLRDDRTGLVQSGLIWTRKSGNASDALDSTPLGVECPAVDIVATAQSPATRTTTATATSATTETTTTMATAAATGATTRNAESNNRKRRKKEPKCCGNLVTDIGPYCREHSIAYDNLYVGPSNIDVRMRGLFACASPLNVVELRHNAEPAARRLSNREYVQYTNRSKPLFVAGDLISHFGGVFYITPKGYPPTQEEKRDQSSYLLRYKDHDLTTDERLYTVVDGCIESSGVARFANSCLVRKDRAIGRQYVNSEISTMEIEEHHGVKIGRHRPSQLPVLVAKCPIYHNDEIIVDYGDIYWTDEMFAHLSQPVQDFLFCRSDVEPAFFSAATVL